MRTPRRPSPALVIAVLALTVAVLSGPLQHAASAAFDKIRGNQIANNAITSPKVKNNNLTGADLKNRSVSAADLRPGTLSRVFWRDTAGNQPLSTPGLASVVSVNVPKGSYLVLGATGVTNVSGASRSAECRISDGTDTYGRAKGLDDTTERSSYITVTGVVKLTSPGTLSLVCSANGASVFTPNTTRPSITAISVGSVADQTP